MGIAGREGINECGAVADGEMRKTSGSRALCPGCAAGLGGLHFQHNLFEPDDLMPNLL